MADERNDDQRTEDPTPRRRDDAKREGRIPRSPELVPAAMLLGSAMMLNLLGPAAAASMLSMFRSSLAGMAAVGTDAGAAVAFLGTLGWKLLALVGVWMLGTAAIAGLVAGVQARGVLSAEPLTPNWGRLNPMSNLGRVFGTQGLVELLKSLLKLTLVAWAMRKVLVAAWPDTLALAQQSPLAFLHVVQRSSVSLLATAGAAYLVLALADYLWQLWQHEKGLKMTLAEVKREMKQNEGDPAIKQRRRSLGRSMARRRMFKDVPTADVVVTNPTHIAVALRYDPDVAPAPIVVAMGQRKVAERIKQIAREAGVPTIENKPLARALLANARVGTMIPSELYVAVAEILAFVIRRRLARGAALATVRV